MQKGLSLISRSPRPIKDHMIITNPVDNQVRLPQTKAWVLFSVVQCPAFLCPGFCSRAQRAVVELRDFAEAVPAQARQTGSAT